MELLRPGIVSKCPFETFDFALMENSFLELFFAFSWFTVPVPACVSSVFLLTFAYNFLQIYRQTKNPNIQL